jgi:HlyD family secretion protein
VASLNAPSLFLIAKDLRRMQVWVAVNEADIGKIHPGWPVSFTVDAFPGENFPGAVSKVRLNASMTQNVVTYTVEVSTDNSNGRLLPYLTANVRFELDHRTDVLLVPNAALRWMPQPEQVAPEFRDVFENPSAPKERAGGGQQQGPAPALGANDGLNRDVVWVPNGQHVRPIPVRVGLTDGTMAEVEGEALTEGLEIVTGQETQARGESNTTNPFAPRIPRRGGGPR